MVRSREVAMITGWIAPRSRCCLAPETVGAHDSIGDGSVETLLLLTGGEIPHKKPICGVWRPAKRFRFYAPGRDPGAPGGTRQSLRPTRGLL